MQSLSILYHDCFINFLFIKIYEGCLSSVILKYGTECIMLKRGFYLNDS